MLRHARESNLSAVSYALAGGAAARSAAAGVAAGERLWRAPHSSHQGRVRQGQVPAAGAALTVASSSQRKEEH